MGNPKVRLDDDTLRTADKTPPFSDDMRHDTTISFDTFKFRPEDLPGSPGNPSGPGGGSSHGNAWKRYGKTSRTKAEAAKIGNASVKKGGQGKGRAAFGKAKANAGKVARGIKRVGGKAGEFADKFNEDLQSERKDNLGLRAIDESKNALMSTKRALATTVKTGKKTAKAAKTTAKAVGKTAKTAAKAAKKVAEVTAKVIQKIAAGIAKLVAFLAANPIVLVVVLAIVVLIVLIYLIFTLFQSTPKNLMGEELYGQIQTYLREKDADILLEFEDFENREEFADIAEDDITKNMDVVPATSMKYMSAYLMAKYENALTLETAKAEIDAIHAQLYRIEHELSTEEYETEEPVLDEQGNPVLNADGTPKMRTVTKEKRVLAVTLTGQTLMQFFEDNLDSLLTPSQKTNYNWYVFISGFGSGEFGPPFEDDNYMAHASQEFGQPGALDGLPHRGIDFSYPEGTPILNIMGGRVVEVSNHWSWGLNIVIESEDGSYRVRYAHMSAIYVSVGETVAVGDIVGLVGNTGTSTGPHLHLEVEENGQLINPREILPVD